MAGQERIEGPCVMTQVCATSRLGQTLPCTLPTITRSSPSSVPVPTVSWTWTVPTYPGSHGNPSSRRRPDGAESKSDPPGSSAAFNCCATLPATSRLPMTGGKAEIRRSGWATVPVPRRLQPSSQPGETSAAVSKNTLQITFRHENHWGGFRMHRKRTCLRARMSWMVGD